MIANGAGSADPSCELACVVALREIIEGGRLSLDDGDLIFSEYLQNLSLAGRPGVGDAFMRWVHDIRFDDAICTRVTLTQNGPEATDFAEYPQCGALGSLDPSDKKFVAVAYADPARPTLVVGIDRGWTDHASALDRAGMTVAFLCDE